MKAFILASLLAVTAASGTVVLADPAAAGSKAHGQGGGR